jgi:hypothetical protein
MNAQNTCGWGLADRQDKKETSLAGESAISSVLARVIGTTGPCSVDSASRGSQMGRPAMPSSSAGLVVHVCERASLIKLHENGGRGRGGWCKQKAGRQKASVSGLGVRGSRCVWLGDRRLKGGQTAAVRI